MNKSDTIGELAKALCKVQAGLQPAVKDANNPFFKSKYADLNSVWNACRELLAANGLAVVQTNSVSVEGTVLVETVLMHSSGEWISGELMLPLVKSDPQGVGSAVTYGRRYGLSAIVGVVADDDDGNHASGKQPQQQKQPPPRAQAKPTAPELRASKIATVQTLCKQLNAAGDSINWSGQKLKEYVNEIFSVSDGLDSLGFESFDALIDDLQTRLKDVESEKAATA